jgi:glycosyltransferase involved in cell wall biosynthesis
VIALFRAAACIFFLALALAPPIMPPEPEIRVARIIARLNVGGPAIHVCNLTSKLASPFISRLYVGEVGANEEEMVDVVQRVGVQPIRVAGLGRAIRPGDMAALWHLIAEFRAFQPHIVHTHTAKAGTLGRLAARAVGAPIVVHTFHGHVLDGYFNPLVTRTFLGIERTLARLSDAIITLSPLQQDDIVTRFRVAPAGKVHVIPLGFDFRQLDDVNTRRGELRRELGISPDVPLIASIGRLTAIKDHLLLLESFRHVRADAQLLVVGGGEEESRIRTLARKLQLEERVRFLGFRSDLDRILADARVIALTSRNEGTPVALIEALAAGCTPVSTAVGGVADVLENGRWGKLVTSRDPAEFGRTLDLAIDEEASVSDSTVLARKKYARARFGVHRLIEEHAALYRKLLEQKQSVGVERAAHLQASPVPGADRGRLPPRPYIPPPPSRTCGTMTASPEIRVASIIARLNVGGPASHVCTLTSHLKYPFVSRLYIGEVGGDEEEMSDIVQQAGVQPTRVAGLGRAIRIGDAAALWNLIGELRAFRPHIVHTHTAKAGTLGRLAARAVGVPIVVHTFHGHVLEGYFNPAISRLVMSVERTLAYMSDAIVTLSPRQKADIVAKYRVAPADKVYVIPLGLDFQKFDDLSSRRGLLRHELGLPLDVPIVASVGRLTAIKDHLLLLDAFRLARSDAHLLIVGGGEEEASIRARVRTLKLEGRVHFLGFRTDLDRILADARVVALTSRNEGTPVALIEALAAGCVPVSVAVGGVADVLEEGKWGKLVETRSPIEFGRALDLAMKEVVTSGEAERKARSRYARERFGVTRLIENHAELYRRLVEKKQLADLSLAVG